MSLGGRDGRKRGMWRDDKRMCKLQALTYPATFRSDLMCVLSFFHIHSSCT
jgi:hypothetical protein